jgi:ferritin-like metal-binding protein YciE
VRKASAQALREGIQMHIEQTQVQIERVEQAMEKLSVKPGRKVCEAMRGLVEEAQHEIEEHDEKGPILDLVIVAGMQRIEHYEIAAYGTGIALAQAVGEADVAALLAETLEEEKQTDIKLTEVTQKAVMPEALAGNEEEGSGERGGGKSPQSSLASNAHIRPEELNPSGLLFVEAADCEDLNRHRAGLAASHSTGGPSGSYLARSVGGVTSTSSRRTVSRTVWVRSVSSLRMATSSTTRAVFATTGTSSVSWTSTVRSSKACPGTEVSTGFRCSMVTRSPCKVTSRSTGRSTT